MSRGYDDGYRYREKQPGIGGRLDVTGWEAKYIGKGLWNLLPGTNADRCMVMTGQAVTRDAHIPIPHRFVRFEWKHTDSSYADSVVATAAYLYRVDNEPSYVTSTTGLQWTMYGEAASTASTTIVPFGESYEYLDCIYRLSFSTTEGHFIFPKLWIQEIRT